MARARRGLARAGAGRRAPTSCWPAASRSCISSAAGRALQTLVAADDPRLQPALAALVEQVQRGPIRRLALEKVDGEPAMGSPLGPALVALGFQEGPRRLTLSALRPPMPEGDTIAYAANRIRPVLEGRVPDEILTPQPRHALDRWPERLAAGEWSSVETHGKHLFLRFEGELVLHSHLGMTGLGACTDGRRWGRSPRRAWLVLARAGHEVVEFDGPMLELMTEGGARFDQRLAALGPDVLAERFDARAVPARGCAPTTRRVRSATRCSTSATSPGSATSGRRRDAGRRRSIRGGRCARCPTPRRAR